MTAMPHRVLVETTLTPITELLDYLREERVDLTILGGGSPGRKEFMIRLKRGGEPAGNIEVPVGAVDLVGEILRRLKEKFDE